MHKILVAGAALALLGATAVHADDKNDAALGMGTGAAAGAVAGGVVGGPIGPRLAASSAWRSAARRPFRTTPVSMSPENPAPPVVLDGELTAETRFDDTVVLTPIPDHPDLAYVYIDNRPVIVRTDSRQVVYAPAVEATTTGSVLPDVPESTITYGSSATRSIGRARRSGRSRHRHPGNRADRRDSGKRGLWLHLCRGPSGPGRPRLARSDLGPLTPTGK
ncbi:hypothetical protein [Thauera sp. SDU_THAU2]|uniref:hypothetical protein n=1 Tax=Thauera sp. SDU_THAU2 TaxID=3136633 RepID=UPI00311FE992